MPPEWDCEAYGPEGREFGATCFVGNAAGLRCGDLEACHYNMTLARERVYGAMQDGAAAGDTTMAYLLEHFTSPDQLLGGSECSGSLPES